MRRKSYDGDKLDVSYAPRLCIHAAECVKRLNAVFDTDKRPWIMPDNAPAQDVAAVVRLCPSGALAYTPSDPVLSEKPDAVNSIAPQENGPLYVRGNIVIESADGTEMVTGTRFALCRCGGSKNKPFCDNTHQTNGFKAEPIETSSERQTTEPAEGRLRIRVSNHGPYLVFGSFALDDDRGTMQADSKCELCFCGGSNNKPFCDGTHERIGTSKLSNRQNE